MSEMSDLGDALDGARLAGALPYIVAEYEKQEAAAISRVDRLLHDGKLTPEIAQLAWIELIAARRMRRRLEQKVRAGISQGETLTPIFNGDPPLPI